MARKWNSKEEKQKFAELRRLYVVENKTIGEVGRILGIAEQTVFQRMRRLGIPSTPERKATFLARKRSDIIIPRYYTSNLAEFFGIMLGDGKLSHYQVVVTLGTKELLYVEYVVNLIGELFGVRPKIGIRKNGFRDIYLGSIELTGWLQKEGLVFNKVLSQVDAPKWIFKKKEYLKRFLRGFFDTDGSVYKLRFGIQISFTNKAAPLLQSVRRALIMSGYHPSQISQYRTYLTRRSDVERFFHEIQPANVKHRERFRKFFI
ncbi:MAG: LAGLIDADG family homing endonuclease [bacterium]|nr:LAGLIDADG family homing endonuclease [bacterium]